MEKEGGISMQSRRAYRPLAILFAFVLMAVMAPMTVFAGGELSLIHI